MYEYPENGVSYSIAHALRIVCRCLLDIRERCIKRSRVVQSELPKRRLSIGHAEEVVLPIKGIVLPCIGAILDGDRGLGCGSSLQWTRKSKVTEAEKGNEAYSKVSNWGHDREKRPSTPLSPSRGVERL